MCEHVAIAIAHEPRRARTSSLRTIWNARAARVALTLLVVLPASIVLPMRSRAQPSPAGTYRAGSSETIAKVVQWGEDCGPRPTSATDDDHPKVEVRANGQHLALAFPDRTIRTDACWSPNPTVRLSGTQAGTGKWRTECRTPDGEAKKEHGVYTLSASGSTLELLEESEYDWQLKKSHCVASVRITQRLTRGDAPPPAPVVDDEPAAPAGCTPGPLAKLRLRPSSAKIGPGEKVCFTVRGFDAAGCVVSVDPGTLTWTLNKPTAASGALSGSCFRAAAQAAEAEGRFQVLIASGNARDQSNVLVATTDLSDITARRGAGGELDEEEGSGIASALGIQAAVKRAPLGTLLFALAMVVALGGLLAWLLLRRRRQSTPLDFDDADAAYAGDGDADFDASAPSPSQPAPGTTPMICPVCRRGYPATVTRCPRDGGVPIPYAEFVRAKQAPSAQPRTCPACGSQIAPGAVFCGACGTKVGA